MHGELAARQRGIVSRPQLLALGIDRGQVQRALARGRLHRVHRGVYALAPPQALAPLALEQAAVLACGPSAVLSHWSAARLHGLTLAFDGRIDVSIATDNRHHPGLVIHRTNAPLHPGDRHRLHRLPVTALPRTLIDLARDLPDRALEHALDEALRKASRAKIREALDRHPRRPGTPRLKALLDPARPSADTWSRAERRLLELIRRSRLPLPEANVSLGRYTPDLLWRQPRVIVEYDSIDVHSGPGAFHSDRDRHNDLTAAGYHVIHVTWRQLGERPEQVLVWIAAALALAQR